jgi:hypothetical protein
MLWSILQEFRFKKEIATMEQKKYDEKNTALTIFVNF